jgi:PAS domain S-box-containing protein
MLAGSVGCTMNGARSSLRIMRMGGVEAGFEHATVRPKAEGLADAMPVMIWQSGPDKAATYFNKPWLEFTGRTFEQESGDRWADGVHPNDVERCQRIYAQAFDARKEFEIEYRLRRHDGEYRWVLDRGRPLSAANGDFLGFIGGCFDITDRKRGETERQVAIQDQALQTLFVIALVARAALVELPSERLIEPYASALMEVLELASSGTATIRSAIQAAGRSG